LKDPTPLKIAPNEKEKRENTGDKAWGFESKYGSKPGQNKKKMGENEIV